jgi:hypothetical protein
MVLIFVKLYTEGFLLTYVTQIQLRLKRYKNKRHLKRRPAYIENILLFTRKVQEMCLAICEIHMHSQNIPHLRKLKSSMWLECNEK